MWSGWPVSYTHLDVYKRQEGYPRNVAYRLTDVGHEFLHVFNKVEAWCEIYLADKAERKAHAAALAE